MILKKIGNRIKFYRKKLGLSQEKFALTIDMDRTYFSAVENGKRNISVLNLDKIINGLGISYSEFFKELS